MVRRLKRSTFEQKRKQADITWLEYEKTVCALVVLYGFDTVVEVLSQMKNRVMWQTYEIADEVDSYDGFRVYAFRLQVINFMVACGYMCSFQQLNDTCDNCKDAELCYETRHCTMELVESRILSEHIQKKVLNGG